jgi:hypothetical protein
MGARRVTRSDARVGDDLERGASCSARFRGRGGARGCRRLRDAIASTGTSDGAKTIVDLY